MELDPEHTFRYRARAADWYFVEAGRDAGGVGKAGDCARDMVGECRRCGTVVCRVRTPFLLPNPDCSLLTLIELHNQISSPNPPPAPAPPYLHILPARSPLLPHQPPPLCRAPPILASIHSAYKRRSAQTRNLHLSHRGSLALPTLRPFPP